MLKDDTRIQLDLYANLNVDKILLGATPLKYEREINTVFVDFPADAEGRPHLLDRLLLLRHADERSAASAASPSARIPPGDDWIFTACEGEGASVWWPNKDQWRDEVENMDISVAIPNDLVDVSNGTFVGKTDLGDGYTRWDWHVHYPINNYDVSLNIGKYVHFADKLRRPAARLLRAARKTSTRPRSSSRRPRA